MIGLDTGPLLRLLRGDAKVRARLREWAGEELATTEWNLLELEALARSDPSPGRERRRAALENLRRRISVVPIDEGATHRFVLGHATPRTSEELVRSAMLAALEARGCRLWITQAPLGRSVGPVKLRIETV